MRRRLFCAGVGVIVVALSVTGCASLSLTTGWKKAPQHPPIDPAHFEIATDATELYAVMRHDWAVVAKRLDEIPPQIAGTPGKPKPGMKPAESLIPSFDAPLKSADRVLAGLIIPVAGVSRGQLKNSYGAPRDGGRRRHRGIDIFSPRGTTVYAVADGEISYVGTQNKAGRSLWLVTDSGVSFFYAHLDRWGNGIREGVNVRKGQAIGYVGNTGNAKNTGHHLHFTIHRDSRPINPYTYLVTARSDGHQEPILAGGLSAGAE